MKKLGVVCSSWLCINSVWYLCPDKNSLCASSNNFSAAEKLYSSASSKASYAATRAFPPCRISMVIISSKFTDLSLLSHFFLINKLLLILFKKRIIYNGGDDDIDYLHNTGKPRPACSNKSAEKDRYSKRWLYDDWRENTCCKQNIVNCDNNS